MLRFISRLRRFLVPAVLIAPAIFICGRLLWTPVYQGQYLNPPSQSQAVDSYDRGWPWAFSDFEETLTRLWTVVNAGAGQSQTLTVITGNVQTPNGTIRTGSFAFFGPAPKVIRNVNVLHFSWPVLAADTAICAAILVGWTALIIRYYRRHSYSWRFSLRTMMLAITAIAIFLAFWMNDYSRWKRQQNFFQQYAANGVGMGQWEPGPRWARCLFSPQDTLYLCRAREIVLNGANFNLGQDKLHFIDALRDLRQIESARIQGADEDAALQVVADFPGIRSLTVDNYDFTDAGLASLARSTSLEYFRISGHFSKVTDAGARSLCQIKSLRKMSLFFCDISDAAIDSILQAPWLEELDLAGCKRLTDAAARRLIAMPHLKSLTIDGPPQLSGETIELLQSKIETVIAY